MIVNIIQSIINPILGPIIGFFDALFPPSFPDDPTNPSTLNTFYTGKSSGALGEESVGDTDFPAGYSFKSRGYTVSLTDSFPIVGTTLTQGNGTAVLAYDGVTITVVTAGTLWGFDIDGEVFHCADGTLDSTDGAYCIGDGGTAIAISTTDINALHTEFIDGVSGTDLNVLGYSIGTGIYAGQVIPPHADNPDVDAINQLPLQYKPRAKYPVELVDGPCLAFDGASLVRFPTQTVVGDFTLSLWYDFDELVDGKAFFGGGDFNYYLKYNTSGEFLLRVGGNVFPISGSSTALVGVQEMTLERIGSDVTLSFSGGRTTTVIANTDDFIIEVMGAYENGANYITGRIFNAVLEANGQTITLPLAEGSGGYTYSKETDENGDPLVKGTITTSDLPAMRAARQQSYFPHATDGYYDNGDGVFYPYPKAGTTFVEPSFLNNGIFKFKLPPAKGLIGPDLLANLAGDGPYLFNAGVPNEFTQAILVSDGVVNVNKLYYMCDDLWTYTDQLTVSQDDEVRSYATCLDPLPRLDFSDPNNSQYLGVI